jgi:hypothetical protein
VTGFRITEPWYSHLSRRLDLGLRHFHSAGKVNLFGSHLFEMLDEISDSLTREHKGVLLSSVQGRRKSLGNPREKDYFCTVVSEGVEILLKRKRSLSLESKNELFVQCNQDECQYVELNQSPCPLRLDLFAEEIEKREKKAQDRKMGF